ncbi:MAG: Rha family transcriptional regulator [Synergistaceae bacterium]|nr:Rha family transcriptional regulator [Synergistaceae bacterium]
MREYFPVKKKEPKTQAIDPASILSAGELGVIEHNGRVMVDSVSLAKVFGKNHKDVLRAIRNLDCSQEFTKRNFTPSSYTDSTGRKLAAYYMTRDGFTFLVMGFTGTIAAKFKEAYINAFNAMEEALKQRKDSGLPKLSLSQADIDKFDNSTPFTADMTAEELADHDGK